MMLHESRSLTFGFSLSGKGGWGEKRRKEGVEDTKLAGRHRPLKARTFTSKTDRTREKTPSQPLVSRPTDDPN